MSGRKPDLFPVSPVEFGAEQPIAGDIERARSTADARNGMPALLPYRWRPGEAEREAEIAARLDAIRVRVAATPAPAPPARPRQRCPECLFMTDTDTHRIVCGSVT